MTRYRGDEIPPVSDYAHWGEDAAMMHYQENRYDMMYAGEPLDDPTEDDRDNYDEECCEECCEPVEDCVCGLTEEEPDEED